MILAVARLAQPVDLKRLGVVVVVLLNTFFRSARLARHRVQLSPPLIDIGVGSAAAFLPLFGLSSKCFLRFSRDQALRQSLHQRWPAAFGASLHFVQISGGDIR